MKYQRGNAVLMVLLILLALTVLGTAILNIAVAENYMTIASEDIKKAQNAADSGIEMVRDFFRSELKKSSILNTSRIEEIRNQAYSALVNPSPFLLAEGSRVIIKEIDTSRLLQYGEVRVVSVGKANKASRKVEAVLSFNTLPVQALYADRLRVVGTYYLESDNVPLNLTGFYSQRDVYEAPEEPYIEGTAHIITPYDDNANIGKTAFWWTDSQDVLEIPGIYTGYRLHYAPYYVAQGRLKADADAVWFNSWEDNPGSYSEDVFYSGACLSQIEDLADPLKWSCVRHEPPRDYSIFRSRHFVDAGIRSLSEQGEYRKPPQFTEEQVSEIRAVAKKSAADRRGKWAYINNGSNTLYIFALQRPYTFVELPAGSTLNISFGVPPGSNIFHTIRNFFWTVITLFTEGVPGVMVVTPADISISFSDEFLNMINQLEQILGSIFSQVKSAQYLFITPNNINISYSSLLEEDWYIYALAGKDLNVICEATPFNLLAESCNRGSFNAGGTLNVVLKHNRELLTKSQTSKADRVLHLYRNTRVIDSFQERWSLLGMGRIVSYKMRSGE
ncbi:PilX N-terminal domain-containing pilus assembly protein [Thermosyntropha sp.]|uniref:PilX N-terminal domain-containing pilus assembly protein n=1 Tax=Thermosyntropha sp. TaxID=2740820 RepID=UPI0025F183F6|nr:PilX N-terminal domain-containing pilus assembly protein [Thermosyntropha sp.]MBO8159235.1 hypothetical protein [Thermosyntropha sp.]